MGRRTAEGDVLVVDTAHSTDGVCELYAQTGAKLTIRKLDAKTILIEGDRTALRFFGELICAHADGHGDDGFQISPKGPGTIYFDPAATLGVYLHRLPCSGNE